MIGRRLEAGFEAERLSPGLALDDANLFYYAPGGGRLRKLTAPVTKRWVSTGREALHCHAKLRQFGSQDLYK